MNFKDFIAIWVFANLIFNCVPQAEISEASPIIPIPDTTLSVENRDFILDNTTGITFDERLKVSANFLKTYIENGSAIKLQSNDKILFEIDENITNPEYYELDIVPSQIVIRAKSDQGAFYAVQTLRQLLPVAFENGGYASENVSIKGGSFHDAPRFKYRGMHLDVGRHMYSVDFIKTYIDALALLKMNTFHWHLTEDQGWRIEIKKYPKLQEIAAFRNETLIGHYSDQPHQFDGKSYGGFYTQEEIKDIVSYAQERFVTIIPEIEMPGHSQAAIAAYPGLGCTGEQVEVATKWGVFEEVYCPSETTFKFLEDVIDEVVELFPGKYIHIGGDEAPKTRWKNCGHCQALIKDKGLKDEHGLQSYFIERMEAYINSKGKQIIGWDEILEGGLAPNATVMSWRGVNGAIEAAKAGHEVILTPTSHCYFDYYQSENEDEPLAIGGFLPLEKVYSFNPIPDELTTEESKFVLGAQGNIWTEYMPTEAQVAYMAFPRMLAMSEVLWSKAENRDYDDFIKRVEHFHKRLDAMDINYANHLYEIEGQIRTENGNAFYGLKTFSEGKTIRYTSDGSTPNSESKIYESELPITQKSVIKAAVFKGDQQLGNLFSQQIKYHKAVGASISIDKEPHKAYSGSGAAGLINGISGSDKRYGDKEWLGFWGETIEVVIDFDKAKKLSSIATRFHNGNGQWIYAPEHIAIRIILEDGTVVANKLLVEAKPSDKMKAVMWDLSNYNQIDAKQIVIMVPNYGTIPEGKQGAGNKAWTFIDEIIVN